MSQSHYDRLVEVGRVTCFYSCRRCGVLVGRDDLLNHDEWHTQRYVWQESVARLLQVLIGASVALAMTQILPDRPLLARFRRAERHLG